MSFERLTKGHDQEYHDIQDMDRFRAQLLGWYDLNKRSLPWRHQSQVGYNTNKPTKEEQLVAYRVWVSEIMLQQTQVVKVKDYYQKWMDKWPTLEDLSKASLDEVHQMWSGLGYYSRGTRLLEAAKDLAERDKHLPKNVKEMEKIKGIGPYTAGAICSIAYNMPVPLVDGNVIRVYSRYCALSGDPKSKLTTDYIWDVAGKLVDPERAGDFNQALMDLGATVCTPRRPDCESCPLKECKAKQEVKESKKIKKADPKDDCKICQPLDIEDLTIESYPGKSEPKKIKEQQVLVLAVEFKSGHYLLVRGPPSGLLANLWDFPQILFTQDKQEALESLEKPLSQLQLVKERIIKDTIVHKFTHIHRTIHLIHRIYDGDPNVLEQGVFGNEHLIVEKSKTSDLGIPMTLTKCLKAISQKTKTLDGFFKKNIAVSK
ncbi:DNA glycosylase [Gorgonomyces haynaldii]|nr:DNA glycosylase [Gorgonomyces haynaldii]